MGKADAGHRAGAWLLAAIVPAAAQAAEPPSSPPPEPGLLEFLAEEPRTDEELGEALLSRDLDAEMKRDRKDEKVKEDDKDPA